MNRLDLENYISETFITTGEQLFAKYPSFRVFRHLGNRKWFAVIMDIPRKNLGLLGDGAFCGAQWPLVRWPVATKRR